MIDLINYEILESGKIFTADLHYQQFQGVKKKNLCPTLFSFGQQTNILIWDFILQNKNAKFHSENETLEKN